MKDRLHHRKVPIYLIISIAILVLALLGLGLSALLFHIGEAQSYPLGPNGEYVQLQIALYHLREVSEGGDYCFVIDEVYHYYEIIPISERLGHAIQSFFTLNWSYSTCMDNAAMLLIVGAALRGSLLTLLFLLLGAFLPLFARFIKKVPVPLYAYFMASAILVALAFLSPLWSTGIGYPTVFLTSALLIALFPIGNRRLRISSYVGIAFVSVGIAFSLYHLIGTYCDANHPIYSLSTLLAQASKGNDNHTLAIATLFLYLYTLIPFAIGAYALAFAYRHKRLDQEKNAPVHE